MSAYLIYDCRHCGGAHRVGDVCAALPSSGQPATEVDQEFYTEPEVIRLREEVNTLKAVASSERERLKALETRWRERARVSPYGSPTFPNLTSVWKLCADELAALLAEGEKS